MTNTAIIILAAGSASRFGRAKQLFRFGNKTLIQHEIDEAIAANSGVVIVVTGAHADEVSKNINQEVQIIFNEQWKEGMASGIAAGVNKSIALNNHVNKIIIAVCDQPFISADLFKQLVAKQHETGRPIIACAYADTLGTPVLFTQKYFHALMVLQGDEGAKKILKSNPEDVATISFPRGNIDIDTIEDYKKLLDNQKHVL
jgi:molybdenum cofactor cytidylyltransferase